MLFAEPTVYFCPACMKPMLKTNYMSYTVHDSTAWSDGERTGYPHFTPNLAKCPNCSAIFFLHNQWPKNEDVPYEMMKHYKNIAHPNLADYIKAIQQGLAKDIDEEIEVRTCLYKSLNNKVRSRDEKSGVFNDDDKKLWQDNCEKLLPLKELKLNAIIQTAKPDEINNLRFEVAELKRNLGRFDECLQTLEDLPISFNWLKRQFALRCKAKDPMVFKIRDRNENPDGDDYFVDEDGKVYHYLDPDAKSANLEKIINHWTEAMERNNWDDLNWQNRAYAYYKKGDYQNALADINHAIEMHGDRPDAFRIRAKIYLALGNSERGEYNLFKASHLETYDERTEGEEYKPLILIEDKWDIIQNSAGVFLFCIRERDGEPVEPEVFYSGGKNALLRRRPDQFILLKDVHKDARKSLLNVKEMIITEVNSPDKKDTAQVLREYTAKLRPVFETLESVEKIIYEGGYLFFTSLRARVYANADKPIAEVIEKEDYINLAAVLAREENYELLDKYFAQGLPINGLVSRLFNGYEPTPLFYITTKKVAPLFKEPFKMLNYLVKNGADINMASGDEDTPLGNQCHSDSSIEKMKALLSAGADPNKPSRQADSENYLSPLFMVLFPIDYDDETYRFKPLMQDNVERAKLLVKAGANVNEENVLGETPLGLAITYSEEEQQGELADLLIKNGADVDTALKGMEKAAKNDYPEYYYALYDFYSGLMYENITPETAAWRNYKKAQEYLKLSAKGGYKPAKKLLSYFEKL